MRRIIKEFNLRKYNTFNIEAYCSVFFMFTDIIEIKAFLKNEQFINLERRVLGGGSNVLITQDFDGVVIHPQNKEIRLKKSYSSDIIVKVGAGMNWDNFVEYAVQNHWYGLENLSGIPGSVGATPIQNIGAYGVEVKDFIASVEAIDIETHKIVNFSKRECEFGYRNSIFKHKFKNKLIITAVSFELFSAEKLNTNYKGINEEIAKLGNRNAVNLRQAILNIRAAKIPKPEIFPNAGSFFKNPILKLSDFDKIKQRQKLIPSYPIDKNFVKIPAAWLIQEAGFKGYQNNKTAVNATQALILINKGGAKAEDLINLADKICKKVKKQFNIELEQEVSLFP